MERIGTIKRRPVYRFFLDYYDGKPAEEVVAHTLGDAASLGQEEANRRGIDRFEIRGKRVYQRMTRGQWDYHLL